MSSVKQASPTNVVYIGAFVHCSSPTDVQVLEKKAVGVKAGGVIHFVEDEGEHLDQRIEERYGWTEWHVVKAADDGLGFFFPGFIGRGPAR